MSKMKFYRITHREEITQLLSTAFGFEKRIFGPILYEEHLLENASHFNSVNSIKVTCNIVHNGSFGNHRQSHSIYEFFSKWKIKNKGYLISIKPHILKIKQNRY